MQKYLDELLKELDAKWSTIHLNIVLRNSRNIAKLGNHLANNSMEGSSGLAILGPRPVLILYNGTQEDMYTVALGKISLALEDYNL